MATAITDAYLTILDARHENRSKTKPGFAVVINMFAKHLSSTQVLMDPIAEKIRGWKVPVYRASIRRTSLFSKAALMGVSVLKMASSHDVSKDLRAWAQEIVKEG
jgi:cellulose biosynthesis protein BcsQ